MEGRGFRRLECSLILDVRRTHLRNDEAEEDDDVVGDDDYDDDNDDYDDDYTFLPSVRILRSSRALRSLKLESTDVN